MERKNRLEDVMRRLQRRLAGKYGEREARGMVREMMRNLKGWDAVQLAIRADEELSEYIIGEAERVVERLMNDEPIQYVFGTARFYGMDFEVNESTLIPRPETAELCDRIVKDWGGISDVRVLDVGTGSGCIAVVLARNLAFAKVTAIDVSGDALDVARGNAERLRARVDFVEADMLAWDGDGGKWDVIVSNPPYIALSEAEGMADNVTMHEPATALFVPDDDALRYYKAVGGIATRCLARGGAVYFEINPRFVKELTALMRGYGFDDVEVWKDMQGRDRMMRARRGQGW